MADQAVFGQIVDYIDQLNSDVGQLTVLVEKLMQEKGLAAVPSVGNQSTWGLTSHFAKPDGWRARDISRVYLPLDKELHDWSVFYLINLASLILFDFPVMVCGVLEHDLLTEKQVLQDVWSTYGFKSLAWQNIPWQNFKDERGYTVAEPTYKTATTRVRGYILNLFDLADRQKVIDNVIRPLTAGDDASLADFLTIPSYRFARLSDVDLAS